ncbi:MAG: signal peptidase II [Actinomycetota bacterium]|nr:signal peptidase II [Actinomycetota bacterium]
MSRAAGLGLALALAFFVLLADQGLKRHIEGSMRLGESTSLIPDVLRLTHIENAGGAFGILDGRGGLLLLGSVIAVAFVLWMLLQGPPDRVTTLGCGLILGGAAGNLLDRLTEGVVTDYLDLEFWPLEAWPVFNAADAAIVFGVLVLLLAALRPEKVSRRSAKS